MATKVIYLGEQPPQVHSSAPTLPPLAPGDAHWSSAPLLQPTQPQPAVAGRLPVTVPQIQSVHPMTQPMMLMYQPPVSPRGSLLSTALLWLVVFLALLGTAAVVMVRVAPDRAAQIRTQLRRPAMNTVAGNSAIPSSTLPTVQNPTVQVRVVELTTDRLVINVVNVGTQPFALAGDAVQVHADAVNYFMPPGTPTVQMQPGDEHQIVISPVPLGTSLVFRLQVPGADTLELKVR